jgi:AraC family transcriptional regulator
MVHCQLPAAPSRDPERPAAQLAACLDLRNAAISASLARLAREVGERGFASEVIVEGLGMFIAGELARHLDEVATRTPRRCGGLAPWQLKRIDEHLNAGNWGCSISELAGQCGISAGHVMRAFRQSTGRTLAGHIAEARIERARDLLSGDELSIGEISRDLQFAHPSSFAAAFRRSTGMTPRQYRQSGL